MASVVFYCHDTLANILSMEYYRQDIEALKALGHDVVICNRYRDIPSRFDVIFVWWWTYALIPVLVARLLGRVCVVTGVYNFRFDTQLHGADYFGRPWHQRLLIRLATKFANANLFVSEREFREVPGHFRLRCAHYFPCAVSEEYFAPRSRLSDRSGLLNIAWSGSDNLRRKGVWDILDAMALLKERGMTVKLTLAGKRGDGYSALQARIEGLGLRDQVELVGEVSAEEKLRLLSESKLYLQPSYFEGFGLATAEAMAAGCCAITCDVGEVRSVVGDAAFYVQPGRPDQLADAVQILFSDQAAVDKFASSGAARIRDLFSFERKVATLRMVLRDVA